jgi:hypothetical protein
VCPCSVEFTTSHGESHHGANLICIATKGPMQSNILWDGIQLSCCIINFSTKGRILSDWVMSLMEPR